MDNTFLMKRFVKCILCFCITFAYTVAANAALEANHEVNEYEAFSDALVKERIANLRGDIDMQYTPESRRMIKNYIKRYRKDSEILLARAGMYFHIFDQALREKNLPPELKYLAIVESALNPKARSKSGAVGLWQFMKPTAKMYSLEINSVVDERRDPNIATHAAFDYLADLEAQFGDWTIALAAYNCGPGNMRKAIRKARSKDYWKVRKYLPKETQEYIPRLIAACYLMNYYHTHDLTPANLSEELALTNTTAVDDKVNFYELCTLLNMEMATVETLNPAFLKRMIPENKGRYLLRLPEAKMSDFLINKEEIIGYFNLEGDDIEMKSEFQKLRSAITVSDNTQIKIISTPSKRTQEYNADNIFRDLKVTNDIREIEVLKDASNNMPQAQELKPAAGTVNQRRRSTKKYEYYKISSGETLLDIINRRKDLKLEDILKINNFTPEDLPDSGTIIKLKELESD